jgi:hypothetical protein
LCNFLELDIELVRLQLVEEHHHLIQCDFLLVQQLVHFELIVIIVEELVVEVVEQLLVGVIGEFVVEVVVELLVFEVFEELVVGFVEELVEVVELLVVEFIYKN